MIIVVIALLVGFGLAILPAIRHDREKFHRHTDPACKLYRTPIYPFAKWWHEVMRGKPCFICHPPMPYHMLHRPESNCPDCEGEVSDMEALAATQGLGMTTSRKARQLIRGIQSTTPDTPECEES